MYQFVTKVATPKAINHHFFVTIFPKLRQMCYLTQLVHTVLIKEAANKPPSMLGINTLTVTRLENHCLTLVVANYTQANQLRYLQQHYVEKLRQAFPEFAQLQRIHVLVTTTNPMTVAKTTTHPTLGNTNQKTRQISHKTKEMIRQTAGNQTLNPQLSQALQRLANTT